MKKPAFVLLIFVALVFLAGCSQNRVVKLTAEDNGRSIDAEVGDTITVTIGGNPTTGYTWEAVELDANILQQVGEPQYKPSSNLLGASGTFVFSFRVVGTGTTSLKLIYHRIWEEGVAPEQTLEVNVLIK